MKAEYDFSQGKKRPEIARALGAKKVVSIRLDEGVLEYFRKIAGEVDMPYQTLINLYLRDCVAREVRPSNEWTERKAAEA